MAKTETETVAPLSLNVTLYADSAAEAILEIADWAQSRHNMARLASVGERGVCRARELKATADAFREVAAWCRAIKVEPRA